MTNKRRINEDFINNNYNNQLKKKFKHKKIVSEEKISKVCIDIVKLGTLVLILVFNNYNHCNKV